MLHELPLLKTDIKRLATRQSNGNRAQNKEFAARSEGNNGAFSYRRGEKDWGVAAVGKAEPLYRRLLRGKSARPKRAKRSVAGSGTDKARIPSLVRQDGVMPLAQLGSLSV